MNTALHVIVAILAVLAFAMSLATMIQMHAKSTFRNNPNDEKKP